MGGFLVCCGRDVLWVCALETLVVRVFYLQINSSAGIAPLVLQIDLVSALPDE
jgi:hypothetical protein